MVVPSKTFALRDKIVTETKPIFQSATNISCCFENAKLLTLMLSQLVLRRMTRGAKTPRTYASWYSRSNHQHLSAPAKNSRVYASCGRKMKGSSRFHLRRERKRQSWPGLTRSSPVAARRPRERGLARRIGRVRTSYQGETEPASPRIPSAQRGKIPAGAAPHDASLRIASTIATAR